MKPIAENRRAQFDYEILEKYEVGIALSGQEVKSAKNGRFNLAGSYAIPKNGELWLLNSDIPAYQPKNAPADYDPRRSRKLLLHKNEIKTLVGRLRQKSLSLVPLNAYLKNGFIKLELGLGKSRKKSDKRELLKKRTAEREMRRFE
ncbi:MAG: SsrA-binding protein SmpB [Candidatus Liptonbacteria bacterium]|nr:SsrA-binding protein SmpB [Candidatus Liptonbacteria bacterium]